MKINFNQFYIQLGFVALVFTASISNSTAQINPLGAQYFHNQYLANPAMAGYRGGMRLNLGYRNQSDNIPGSPKNLSVTGDYGTEKVGVGINFFKDEAGLFNRSRLQGTYAYHLPLDDSQKLHCGISLGIQTERLNNQAIVGSPNDQVVISFNDQESILDGDFGMAYTSSTFSIMGSISNLSRQLKIEDEQTADFGMFYTAVGYKIKLTDWHVEPKVAYRGFLNFQNILDVGAEISTSSDQLLFMSMYHSNKTMSFGISYHQKKDWKLFLMYNNPTQELKSYATGTFEIGLQLILIKKLINRDEFIY
ncbi:MAG: PorP/SprF family type IX secretion system membrane protein [Sphingobacterium thalpophilum]